jgi:ferredoxin
MDIVAESKFMPIKIMKEKCPKNHRCPALSVCPVNALEQHGVDAPTLSTNNKCIDCGKCLKICPTGALALEIK